MRIRKLLAMLMAIVMLLGVTGVVVAEQEEELSTPLVVGYSNFSGKFSPFFGETAYDMDVSEIVSPPLLTVDRTGAIVGNAIEGETIPYNGTDYTYIGPANVTVEQNGEGADLITTYTIQLREDILFSDGTPMTADDMIFAYYVLLDPAYVGASTLYSYDIVGLDAYRTSESMTVINDTVAAIQAAGEGYTVQEGDLFTQEQYDAFWKTFGEGWREVCQGIVDYVYSGYGEDYAESFGITYEELTESDGWKVIMGMNLWGFGDFDEGVFSYDDKTFDTAAGEFPTIEDYYAATFTAYAGDGSTFFEVENAGVGSDFQAIAKAELTEALKEAGLTVQADVPNIEGIKKVDDRTVTIEVNGFSAPAVYSLCGIQPVPRDYYGDGTYDYEANNFGHPYGDLSVVESKTSQPIGYGPYKFVKYENRVVYFEANEHYFKGAPKTEYMQWKETDDADKVPGVTTGTIDATDPSFSKNAAAEIKSANENGELDGNVLVTALVDNLGYGYIGINAAEVNVGGVPDSEESKNLRRGLATLLSVYRDVVVDSYYGDAASVINYPISNTSWAAPQKTDDDYKTAFSTALDGSDIYTAEMTAEERYEAALAAAVEYFEAAGYVFEDGVATAPEGAALEYEAIIPGDGTGNHPSFGILTDVKNALATIGLTLTINDPADSNVLWDRLDVGTAELWCAAWQATIDPDMYQTYHSSNIVGLPNASESNHYHITDSELDQLILDARTSADQGFRKAAYKSCLDIIIDWAVEVPVYQRQNCYIFSAERLNLDTVCKDITTFYSWLREIENMEMAEN